MKFEIFFEIYKSWLMRFIHCVVTADKLYVYNTTIVGYLQ